MIRKKLSDWNDELDFGKFKGKTVKEVFEYDPTYLSWAMKETNRTDFKENIKKSIKDRKKEIHDEKYSDLSWGDFHT